MNTVLQLPTATFFQLPFLNTTQDVLINFIISESLKKDHSDPLVIFTPNPEQVVLTQKQPSFLVTLQKADVLLPDGQGIVWASQWLKGNGESIQERIAGVDVVKALLDQLPKTTRVLLVGGQNYHLLQYKEHQIRWEPTYQDVKNPQPEEETQLQKVIQEFQPDLVFVAFGAPYQEEWVIAHLGLLKKSGVKLVMVVGGAFDVLLGKVPRAPLFIQHLGLEWLYRLIQQPWRWRRQLRLIEFIGLVGKQLLDSFFFTRVHTK